jgi:uncharacterized protein YjbI with pentapeptide repeats
MTVDEFKAALTDRSLVTKISGGAKLPRLENLDLRSYHFDGFDLRSAETLSHTDLTHAYLNDAVLAGVALLETTFVDASLRRANLTNSDLRGSNLTRADLHGANLLHADVRGAVLVDARGLTDEQLSQACGDDQTLLSPGQFISRTWSCQ